MQKRSSVLLIGMLVVTAAARAQVLQVKDLNTEQIRSLDRAKTAVILAGGIHR